MSATTVNELRVGGSEIPAELSRLQERIDSLPENIRAELAPLAAEALDASVFRSRVLSIAREGLERFRLDLAVAKFDLEATRREREILRRKLESLGG